MNRCVQCILPESYPGITLDEEGKCNYCLAHRHRGYLGAEALREKIDSILKTRRARNDEYDCVLALSGGRDSSYLLYYLVRVLNLRVLAYFLDNGFIPEQTKRNIDNMVTALNVELVTQESGHLRKCIKHHMFSWMRRPSAPMVGMLCTGCRLGMATRIRDFAQVNEIPIIIDGSTPVDIDSFKRKIMSTTLKSRQERTFVWGYLYQILLNPSWVLNPNSLITQGREYYHNFLARKRRSRDSVVIRPFMSYIRWEERAIISTIEQELQWAKHPGIHSSWRGDCDIALLKLYLYKATLGFNDKDEGLSYLIRDGQITRQEGLERLEREAEIPEEIIEEILDRIGLRFLDLETALSTFKKPSA